MSDHTDLHRHDIQLLAGFFADRVFTATTGTGQFVFGQFVDGFDTRQVSRQRLAFATAGSGHNHYFFRVLDSQHRLAFRLIEQCQLRGVGLDGLFRFSPEQAVAQQLDLLSQVDDVAFMGLQHFGCFAWRASASSNSCLSRIGSSGRSSGRGIIARIIPGQVTKRGIKT
ncbi:hypothetical protein D3C77_434670 [compost metagenome]